MDFVKPGEEGRRLDPRVCEPCLNSLRVRGDSRNPDPSFGTNDDGSCREN